MGDEDPAPEETPAEEEKLLNVKFNITGARSIGQEPLDEGADPEAPWNTLVQYSWPGEEEPFESEMVEGRGEVSYVLEKEWSFPYTQETYDLFAATTITVKLCNVLTEVGKSGEPERIPGPETNSAKRDT